MTAQKPHFFHLLATLFALSPALPACGEAKPSEPEPGGGAGGTGGASAGAAGSTGGPSGQGGNAGSGGANVAGAPPVEGQPLLDRPGAADYECSVTRGAQELEFGSWRGGALASAEDAALLVRSEAENFDVGSRLVASTLALDGALGEPVTLATLEQGSLEGPALVQRDGRADIVWLQSDALGSSRFFFAAVDESGSLLDGPTPIDGASGQLSEPIVVSGPQGMALLWSEQSGTASRLMFGVLGEDGTFLQTPSPVETASTPIFPAGLLAVEGGYLATYWGYVFDPSGSRAEAHLLKFDQTGNDVKRTQLGQKGAGTFSAMRDALLHRGDHALVAWAEGGGNFDLDQQEGHVVIRISRVDLEGARTGADVRLQAPVTDTASVDPHFVELGNSIGLAWSEGEIIYICAGCMPNNRVKFVVLNGSDLTPRSDVIELLNPKAQGGLMSPQIQPIGDDLLMLADIQFHVHAEAASGSFRCLPKP